MFDDAFWSTFIKNEQKIFWGLPKIILIGPQGLVLPIVVKWVYWGLEDMEHPIHTKFYISDCMLTINVISKNYLG